MHYIKNQFGEIQLCLHQFTKYKWQFTMNNRGYDNRKQRETREEIEKDNRRPKNECGRR